MSSEKDRAWERAYAGRPEGSAGELRKFARAASASRGVTDARAAWLRWHDERCDQIFTDSEQPWYQALERTRVETLAAGELPGMQANLWRDLNVLLPVDPNHAQLYLRARYCFAGRSWPTSSLDVQILRPHNRMGWLTRAVKRLGLPAREATLDFLANFEAEIDATITAVRQLLNQPHAFAHKVKPLISRLAEAEGSATPEYLVRQDDLSTADDKAEETIGEKLKHFSDSGLQSPAGNLKQYAVYDSHMDELAMASYWYQDEDGAALAILNQMDRQRLRQLAHRFQRRLLAARLRHWSFDQEQGMLDSRRLARLVGERPNVRVFRVEEQASVPEACVTLLVDQSGSMRGEGHLLAAQAIDIVIHTLELCNIRCELLGYTTRFQSENDLFRRWLRDGRQMSPGRLNALRHIVFKSANQPWRVARRYLGLLLRPEFGNENIDGESLEWAARRLLAQPESNRVLIVLSDGAPYDEATVEGNGPAFLQGHLHQVIQTIQASNIQLVGLGMGRDVGRYYPISIMVRSPEAIGDKLFQCLAQLLDSKPRSAEVQC